jgi:hypothetical protein
MFVPKIYEVVRVCSGGNGLYIPLKKPFRDELGIKQYDLLMMSVNKNRIIVSKAPIKKLLRVQQQPSLERHPVTE